MSSGEQTKPPEKWQNIRHLAGLIDGEGTFTASPHYAPKACKWYVDLRFVIHLAHTSEWEKIATYWQKIYRGKIYHIKLPLPRKPILRWAIYDINQLEKFLNDVTPYLTIKKKDAEKMKRFITRYKLIPYREKGQLNREKAKELWKKLF